MSAKTKGLEIVTAPPKKGTTIELKEEKKFPIEYVMAPPTQEGVTIVRYGWARVGDIHYKYQNYGRVLGNYDKKHMLEFTRIFNQGFYNPFHHEPIIIDETGRLICGRHRVQGAEGSDKGTETLVWVCVMEFANSRVRKQYAIKENVNTQTLGKLVANEDDIIYNIVTAIQDGDCNANQTSVRNYLKEIAPNASGKQRIIDSCLKEVGVKYENIDPPTNKQIEDHLEEIGVDPQSFGESWMIKTLRAGKGEAAGDRKARLLKSIRPRLVQGKDTNIAVTFTQTSSSMLNAARSHTKNELIKEYITECCEVADAFRAGTLGKTNFHFPKQTAAEDATGEFFVEVQ